MKTQTRNQFNKNMKCLGTELSDCGNFESEIGKQVKTVQKLVRCLK